MTVDAPLQLPRLRMWPAVIITTLQCGVSYYFKQFGSSQNESVLGNVIVPVASLLLLLLWWLFASRALWRDRLLGLVLFLAVAASIVLPQSNPFQGGILLSFALLVMTTGSAYAMAIAGLVRPGCERWAGAAVLLLSAAVYACVRVDTVGSDFVAQTSWRWHPARQAATGQAGLAPDIKGTATLPGAISVGDWPGFRGPNRDGQAVGVTFGTDWSTPPKELWRRPAGAGHSSFVVLGDVFFTQEQAGAHEIVGCFNAATGAPIWTYGLPVRHDDTMGGVGPRATPAYANGKLYAQSAGGTLLCLDAATGALVWKQEMTTPENQGKPEYGYVSSPLVLGDLVIQYACGAGRSDLAAFNAATGAEVWSAAQKTGGYSSPHYAEIDGVKQVLHLNSAGLQGYVPKTGAKLWEHVWQKKQYPRCVQPLLAGGGLIALGATTDFGTRGVKVSKNGEAWDVSEAWNNRKHRPYFNDNVAHKGYIYGFDGNRLCCLNATTGEQQWQGERYGGQVLALPDMDLLLVLTEKGEVVLVKADPAAFTVVAQFKAIDGKTWNHPVIAHGKLFVRNSDEMACFAL